jgi:hypothetical protein
MIRTLRSLLILSMLCLVPFLARSQSTMEFQSGTTIEVQSGADICADIVLKNGTTLGSGTQCLTVLPVELVSFSVTSNRLPAGRGCSAELIWNTATEVNNYGFEVERRGIQNSEINIQELAWKSIGSVPGSGTSNAPKGYSFADQNVTPGRYAYRIKQIDNGGSFKYSASVEADIGLAPREFMLGQNFPNPFNPTTSFEFTLPEDGRATLKVYNMVGQEVAVLLNEEMKAGVYHQAAFNADRLASGTYFARLEFNGKSLVKKLLLMK